jgi:hypothetical protein
MRKLTNEDIISMKKRIKVYRDRARRLTKRRDSIEKTLSILRENISQAEMVDDIYDGIALHEFNFLGYGWVRCDQYNTDKYRSGRYWDNAHNPGKGEWNIELEIHNRFGRDERKFFAFSFGTEKECIDAIKEWAAHGKLPNTPASKDWLSAWKVLQEK